MMKDYLNTKELSEYLDINEKKIYSLIIREKLPGTKITGKWLFPKSMVDAWLNNSVEHNPDALKKIPDVLMIAGSNDPVLEYFITNVSEKTKHFVPYFSRTGSLNGLLSLKENKADICCCHLFNPEKKEYNLSFIHSYLKNIKVVVTNYAYREQGLLFRKDNPFMINGIKDLIRPEIKFINRQKGSGTRLLLDEFLKINNISGEQINGYETEVTTHLEVGVFILNGEADAGLGIKNIATRLNLGFIPIKKERFDFIIKKDNYFSSEIQLLLEIIRSVRVKTIEGYDMTDSGKIMYSSE